MNIAMHYCKDCNNIILHREVFPEIWECDCCGSINADVSNLEDFDDDDTIAVCIDDTLSSENSLNNYSDKSKIDLLKHNRKMKYDSNYLNRKVV